jgi:tRNA pseudouridine(55) synthase
MCALAKRSPALLPFPWSTRFLSTPPPSDVSSLHGVFTVFKPKDVTSSAVVNHVKHALIPRVLARKSILRVGHGGTLDKSACGLLVIGVGRGTKQLTVFLASEKVYRARAQLGIETDSHDMDEDAKVVWSDRTYSQI